MNKVYCKNCRYFRDRYILREICNNRAAYVLDRIELSQVNTYYEPVLTDDPSQINENNNCKYFSDKYERKRKDLFT